MRFALLASTIFLAGTGAAGMKLGILPSPADSFTLNPVRAAYDYVIRQVTTPEDPQARLQRLGFQPSTMPPADFSAMEKAMAAKPLPGAQLNFGANVAPQTQQFNNRMEDLRNYARNPAGWHGAPPQ